MNYNSLVVSDDRIDRLHGQLSCIPALPTGVRPSTPQELESMLEADLTEYERRTITIHMIDCSARQGKT
ncbi:hypothetical protein [Hydrogenophaga sp. RAC07]|uniref:hypothetical protein n=1 Tax=Hydrogenophaga sp. RAC07 TaxID=1842537 RepID=UPI00083CE4B2|nr:hypothetical protein [Hydrogenophaga sp. RAC07]